jgi:predicted  nucleic acid-binding Zn-ribbon protein
MPQDASSVKENTTMSHTSTELKDELKKSLALLQTLRDEVRVKLHLAGMDLKDEWAKLEPHLAKVEQAAAEASDASRAAVTEAVAKVKKLRDSLI